MCSHALFNTLCGLDPLEWVLDLSVLVLVCLLCRELYRMSPSREWTLDQRKEAMALLRDSLAVRPRSGRNRVRLALYLMAGGNPRDAREALSVLGAMPMAWRNTRTINFLETWIRWCRDEWEGKSPDTTALARLLEDDPDFRSREQDLQRNLIRIRTQSEARTDRGRGGIAIRQGNVRSAQGRLGMEVALRERERRLSHKGAAPRREQSPDGPSILYQMAEPFRA